MTEINQAAGSSSFEGRYAGFWIRVIAATIDLLLYTPLYLFIKKYCGSNHIILREVVFSVIALGSYAYFFSSKWQASPGMLLMKFHVCDEDGNRLSYPRALWWGVVSSFGVLFCCAGVLYMQYYFNISALNELLLSCAEENVRTEDCLAEVERLIGIPYQTFAMMAGASVIMAVFLLLIWSLSVALARDKSGFNNLICHTRFLKGRA